MKDVKAILEAKGHQIWSVTPNSTVYEAIEMMSERGVGALLVMDGDLLAGIVSERDYARTVILVGRASKDCVVGDVMTKIHATGSAFTYGQRYLLKLIFNVAVGDDDDDGNKAGGGASVSAEEKAELIDLIKKSGADTAKFCKYLGVAAIDYLPAARFLEAKAALENKRASK